MIKEVNTAEFKEAMPNGLTLADFYSPPAVRARCLLSYFRTWTKILIFKF